MTKTTTYYAQNPQIDSLVSEFGSQLEKLSRDDKLSLRMLLVAYVFLKEIEDEWDLISVETEVPLYEIGPDLEEAIAILDGIDIDAAEGLIEALTAQLRHGNARRRGD